MSEDYNRKTGSVPGKTTKPPIAQELDKQQELIAHLHSITEQLVTRLEYALTPVETGKEDLRIKPAPPASNIAIFLMRNNDALAAQVSEIENLLKRLEL